MLGARADIDDEHAGDSGLADWDYVAGEGEGGRGAQLWQRARARVGQLARLQNLTRAEFLIWLLLTLAAKREEAPEDSVD